MKRFNERNSKKTHRYRRITGISNMLWLFNWNKLYEWMLDFSLIFNILYIFVEINIWNFKLNRSMLFQCDQHNLPESIQFRKIYTNYVARAGVDRVHMHEKWTIWFKIMDSISLSCHFNSKAHNNHAHQIVRLNFNIGEMLATTMINEGNN